MIEIIKWLKEKYRNSHKLLRIIIGLFCILNISYIFTLLLEHVIFPTFKYLIISVVFVFVVLYKLIHKFYLYFSNSKYDFFWGLITGLILAYSYWGKRIRGIIIEKNTKEWLQFKSFYQKIHWHQIARNILWDAMEKEAKEEEDRG